MFFAWLSLDKWRIPKVILPIWWGILQGATDELRCPIPDQIVAQPILLRFYSRARGYLAGFCAIFISFRHRFRACEITLVAEEFGCVLSFLPPAR
ncbi:hypothetical protein M438DRAFT_216549 [Aureobasidium pullulans EXF-150]|uniref:Uncharacterized protein n=1 Tax=Aureobasidium pullulans EXF-150 TaxID=1043002 RepID=A0A074XGE0_AURPU|nr:uncharacterized protein M438DRAFT_216549 [Aureobasidium pullulans EXF-150]KEQ84580.1 hypothetical protein M438DRAFT_216549 [Aureobasidium pullulans EXF-150]